jgi:hypothetical protein
MTQSPKSISLSQLAIKEPCHADWDAMTGDQSKRFCSGCQKHVHNLDALSQPQIDALFEQSKGKLCIRYTPPVSKKLPLSDPSSPEPLNPIPVPRSLPRLPRQPLLSTLSRMAAGILLASSLAFASGCNRSSPSSSGTVIEQFNDWRASNLFNWVNTLADPLFGTSPSSPPMGGVAVMGDFAPTTGAVAPAPAPVVAAGAVAIKGEAVVRMGDVADPPAATQPTPAAEPAQPAGLIEMGKVVCPAPATQPAPAANPPITGLVALPLPAPKPAPANTGVGESSVPPALPLGPYPEPAPANPDSPKVPPAPRKEVMGQMIASPPPQAPAPDQPILMGKPAPAPDK